jgi:hypothetical protein
MDWSGYPFYGVASALQKKIGAKARCRLIGMFIFNIKYL